MAEKWRLHRRAPAAKGETIRAAHHSRKVQAAYDTGFRQTRNRQKDIAVCGGDKIYRLARRGKRSEWKNAVAAAGRIPARGDLGELARVYSGSQDARDSGVISRSRARRAIMTIAAKHQAR